MRALGLVLLLASTAAAAEPALALGSDGERLAVTARGAVGPAMPEAHGDAIEVALKSVAQPARVESSDATVKRLTLVAGSRPRLVIALHHSKHTTEKLAAEARVEMIDGALRVTFPREPGVAALPPPVAVAAPQPNAVEAPKSETQPVKPEPKAVALVDAKPEAKPATRPQTDAKPQPTTETLVAAPLPARVANDEAIAPASAASERPMVRTPWLVALAIVCLPLVWLARKKKQSAAPAPSLRVLASQSLGGKSRLVLVEAEGRRILLAVNDANTRVVTQYDHDAPSPAVEPQAAAAIEAYAAAAAADDAPVSDDDDDDDVRAAVAAVARPTSPAVSGLLKLRGGDAAGPTEWGEALRRAARRLGSQ